MTGGTYRQKAPSLDELPTQFVAAMRTLFNVMDDRKTGFVKFSDIVSHWQEDASGLPKGVIDSLRKVTPDNGLLSFERFCAGLRICLLRHRFATQQVDALRTTNPDGPPPSSSANLTTAPPPVVKLRQAPKFLSDDEDAATKPAVFRQKGLRDRVPSSKGNTAAVLPNNAKGIGQQQRTVSMPHLQVSEKANAQLGKEPLQNFKLRGYRSELKIHNPPETMQGVTAGGEKDPATTNRVGIMTALQRWRWDLLSRGGDPEVRQSDRLRQGVVPPIPKPCSNARLTPPVYRSHTTPQSDPTGSFDDVAKTTATYTLGGKGDTEDGMSTTGLPAQGGMTMRSVQNRGPTCKRVMNRYKDARRHTVASGIDYNMVKRLKLLEQERDILLQGLEVVKRACEWYNQHINNLQDKMQCMEKNNTFSDYSTDAHQERIKFVMTRIYEVNQHLTTLMESFEKGFPLHMNLAVHQPNFYKRVEEDSNHLTQQRLKEQNQLLTEEVSKKSEQISQLEREKSALVRELFHARAQQHGETCNETTFM